MYFLPHLKHCPRAFPVVKPPELQISLVMDRCAKMQFPFYTAWPTTHGPLRNSIRHWDGQTAAEEDP
ncbi:hypothetical protein CCMA1212_000453 [Trichoderma ghanense]|uniref:Uncharacterized protein n=1 Tax=Trichoderma ghanense TaxID=65468 RepID=A0ABY2HFY7_9HYPO